jgi:hypothetical protein
VIEIGSISVIGTTSSVRCNIELISSFR